MKGIKLVVCYAICFCLVGIARAGLLNHSTNVIKPVDMVKEYRLRDGTTLNEYLYSNKLVCGQKHWETAPIGKQGTKVEFICSLPKMSRSLQQFNRKEGTYASLHKGYATVQSADLVISANVFSNGGIEFGATDIRITYFNGEHAMLFNTVSNMRVSFWGEIFNTDVLNFDTELDDSFYQTSLRNVYLKAFGWSDQKEAKALAQEAEIERRIKESEPSAMDYIIGGTVALIGWVLTGGR